MTDLSVDLILEDARIILRPVSMEDLPALQQIALQFPEIWQFSPDDPALPGGMERYLQACINGRLAGHTLAFVVFDKILGRIIGSSRYYELESRQERLSIGYTWLVPDARGTGINYHMKYLMFRQVFEVWQMRRVALFADVTNMASVRAMEKAGCVREGVMRDHLWLPNGRRRDTVIYSVLQEDWQMRVKAHLEGLLSQLD